MDTRQNRALVGRYYDKVLNGRDLAVLDEIVADDYVENDPLPGQGSGRDGLRQRVEMLIDGLDPHFTVEDMIAEGDRVAVRWTTRGTHDGELLGFAPTGTPVAFTGISFFTVRCGKVVEFQTEMDAAGLLEQVGAPVRDESR